MGTLERRTWKRTGPSGPQLSYAVSRAAAPKAAVGIVHGYAEYGERYAPTMALWAERGLTSVCFDLRGHGRSEGTRGHVLSFQEYLDDFRELDAMLDAEAKGLPRLLFAHSFGAVVSLKGLLAGIGSWKALALSEPYLGLALEVPGIKKFAGEVASKLFPSLGLPSGLTGAQMTTSSVAAQAHDTDPLIFGEARARWFTETLAAQAEIEARAREITLPLLLLFATDDPVAKRETARRFFDGCGSADKTWESLEGLRHEPLNEPEHGPRIAARIADFLLAHG